MNIDDLKIIWQEYDRKLESTHAINEKIILSMITERSGNRFSNVRRRYQAGLVWMFICLSFSTLVILTNPFDYRYTIQYTPIVIFALGLVVLIIDMGRSYATFEKISLTHHNIGEALKRIIAVYEKPRKFLRYVIYIFLFSQVVLFPLSFLPRNMEQMGWWQVLGERLIPIAINGLLVFAAYKMGAFKERNADKFREDFNELQSLKKMSRELEYGDSNQ